jgi:tRNA-modifying protein YgfZ
MTDLSISLLSQLGVLRVRGADARHFLQGQLSQDLEALDPKQITLAGLHNAKGRCLAVLRLLPLDQDSIALVLPRDLIDSCRTHLQRYVLRARAQLTDDSNAFQVWGETTGLSAGAAAVRRLHITAPDKVSPAGHPQSEASWLATDIAQGLPQVFKATSGLFTAQNLNLDRVNAISFTKGCYTGQEIIARAHYLGTVRKRMRRFQLRRQAPLTPGEVVNHAGERLRVVQSVVRAADVQEFLAIPESAEAQAQSANDVDQIQELPLPYALADA